MASEAGRIRESLIDPQTKEKKSFSKCQIGLVALGVLVLIGSLAAAGALFPQMGPPACAIGAGGLVGIGLIAYAIWSAKKKESSPDKPIEELEADAREGEDELGIEEPVLPGRGLEPAAALRYTMGRTSRSDPTGVVRLRGETAALERRLEGRFDPAEEIEDTPIILPYPDREENFTLVSKIAHKDFFTLHVIRDKRGEESVLRIAHKNNAYQDSDGSKDPDRGIKDILEEYEMGSRFNHSLIIRMDKEVKPTEEKPYLKRERIEGTKLLDYLQRGKLSMDECTKLVYHMTDAALHMIRKGVLPGAFMELDNLIVDEEGDLKIVDFNDCCLYKNRDGSLTKYQDSGQSRIERGDHGEEYCLFRQTLEEVLSVALQVLEPHRDQLTGWVSRVLSDDSLWKTNNDQPFLHKFPPLQDGTSIEWAASLKDKEAYVMRFLAQFRDQVLNINR